MNTRSVPHKNLYNDFSCLDPRTLGGEVPPDCLKTLIPLSKTALEADEVREELVSFSEYIESVQKQSSGFNRTETGSCSGTH